MSQISVSNLTFAYEGSFDNIFEDVSFMIDTDWKLGFIGRNGKGKTTFLNILLGKHSYKGSIRTDTVFDYFPYAVANEDKTLMAAELMYKWKADVEDWQVLKELPRLQIGAETLYRPFDSLSFGERTKIMLAVLFSGDNNFLLIDEPTNHLDSASRNLVKDYLRSKKGFILVSHDRDLLDACIDHVLVLNRASIEVQSGNFTSWWENKERADAFARAENAKHAHEIDKLKRSADRTLRWAEKSENSKIGFDPVKEHDRSISTRSYIGAKTKKMQSRVKNFQGRMERKIEEKEGLLQDIEEVTDLKINVLTHYKERLVHVSDYSLKYIDAEKPVFEHLCFDIMQGDRVFLYGENGCGKSSVIRALLKRAGSGAKTGSCEFFEEGVFEVAPNLEISYIDQDTSHLSGNLKQYAEDNNLDYSLFLTLLRKLDLEKVQFEKDLEDYSEGQKKKVLIAAGLITPAHLYIWDEPLNYIDVFSRMQIEKLIETFKPTMLMVEHDVRFRESIATKTVEFLD